MLLAGKEFGFVAIVGALGLVGMMIKNGVVLVDEVNIQIQGGKEPFLGCALPRSAPERRHRAENARTPSCCKEP